MNDCDYQTTVRCDRAQYVVMMRERTLHYCAFHTRYVVPQLMGQLGHGEIMEVKRL